MALIKKPTFEQEPTAQAQGDTAVEERVAKAVAPAPEMVEVPVATPTLEAQVVAEVAITKAATTSLSTADAAQKAKQFQREFEDMKDASSFDYGTYRTFKGNNGSIVESGDGGEDLGRWAKIRIISWGRHYEVSPGESGASTKDYVAYSKDGKTLDSVIGEELKSWVGKPVADYVEYLRNEEEFASTKTREFIDMGCALLATDSGDGPIGKVIQITLSETSIPSFSRYQQELKDTARCVSMGLPGFAMPDDPFSLFVVREVASRGTNRWTKLMLTSTLPAKI